ncbi:helix-turn-helix domain-containing protein [Marinibacterium profundimaris]|uniref:HTH cro/C1-type domain-containing protein n=1 Tax=Marinibacterium profundimaris TaxID=1679460 RepID=A0A225NP34_9RHOB|nr:XRE family transcriptional regulator [Marinibacterium profundimaris]OWU76113.1 hypothetical protein ATO3_08170 [Marinibacterium profundimaris]
MGGFTKIGNSDHLNDRIARCLRDLRHRAGWSLDELTDRCGVSRATLSRLEHGEVSPTAHALARIAEAYDMPASRLVRLAEAQAPQVLPRDSQSVTSSSVEGTELRSVSPNRGGFFAEVCEGALPQHAELSVPGTPGDEIHIVVLDGRLEVTIDGIAHDLRKGDSLRFHLDGPAMLRGGAKRATRFMIFLA